MDWSFPNLCYRGRTGWGWWGRGQGGLLSWAGDGRWAGVSGWLRRTWGGAAWVEVGVLGPIVPYSGLSRERPSEEAGNVASHVLRLLRLRLTPVGAGSSLTLIFKTDANLWVWRVRA